MRNVNPLADPAVPDRSPPVRLPEGQHVARENHGMFDMEEGGGYDHDRRLNAPSEPSLSQQTRGVGQCTTYEPARNADRDGLLRRLR